MIFRFLGFLISMKKIISIISAVNFIKKNSFSIKSPVLIVYGSEDVYFNKKVTKKFVKNLKCKDKELKVFKNCYHEMYIGKDKADFMNVMLCWLNKRLSPEKKIDKSLEFVFDFKNDKNFKRIIFLFFLYLFFVFL